MWKQAHPHFENKKPLHQFNCTVKTYLEVQLSYSLQTMETATNLQAISPAIHIYIHIYIKLKLHKMAFRILRKKQAE